MKVILWWCYATAVIFLVTFNFHQAINSGAFLIRNGISVAITLLCLVGIYGFVYQKPIYQRVLWVFLFWLMTLSQLGSIVISSVIAFNVPAYLLSSVIELLIILPLLYALYRYGSVDNPIWGIESQVNFVNSLERLLSESDDIKAVIYTDQPDGQLKTTTRISKADNGYLIQIDKECAGEKETFSNSLPNLTSLANFLRFNTLVRPGDFVRQ